MLVRYLPAFLLVGCTLVLSEGDPDSEQTPNPTPTPDAGNLPGDAGASNGGSGAGTAQAGGAGGEGGEAVDPTPMGGQGASGGAVTVTPGLGVACSDDSGCPEGAPECPAAAGYCTFYCDEAWINGWQYVPSLVAQCEDSGGECTPIGEERSYCVP